MRFRFLLLIGAASMAVAQTAPIVQPTHGAQARSPLPQVVPVIRFEDASDKAGINFTHSFGSRQMVLCLKIPAQAAFGSTTTIPALSLFM